jgi:hypothetical protein
MACPRLIALYGATAILLVAGHAHAQSVIDFRPTVWDTEADIALDDPSAAQDAEAEIPPPSPEAPETTLEVDPPEEEPPAPQVQTATEDDPYAPLGWRFGNMRAFFAVEVGANFTDNVELSEIDRKSDVGLLLAPKFKIDSDWSRHKFTAEGSGSFVRYANESEYDTEEADARADLRVDVRRNTALDLAAFYLLTQDTAAAIDVPDEAIGTRTESFYGGSVALTQNAGDLLLRLKSGVAREYYGDVQLPNNVVDDGTDQNYVELAFSFRAAYAPTPSLRPFAEVAYLPRYRDEKNDRNGLSRSSNGYAATVGIGFDPSPIWSGEFGLIYIMRDYDDPSLAKLDAFGPIGRITWSPNELTSVALSAATYLDEAVDPLSSGTRNYSAELDISHEMRENLTLATGVGATYQDTQGVDIQDLELDANAGITWQITRWLAWKANYEFTWLDSNVAGSDYKENQVSVGIEVRN